MRPDVAEVEDQVLRPPVDALDRSADQRLGRGHDRLQRREPERLDALEHLAGERVAEALGQRLHLRAARARRAHPFPRRRPPTALPLTLALQLAAHLVAARLQVAERERVGVGVDEEGRLHRVGIGRGLAGVDADLAQDAVAVGLGEVRVDRHHLLEHVEVGSEDRGRAVEEHRVLHEQHELLRHPRAVAEQLLRDLAHLGHERVGRHLGGVLHRTVEVEVARERVEVDVGRERTEVAQRDELTALVAGGAEHQEAQEREALRLGEPTGHAEVEQRGAAVGLHDEVAAVQVAVEDAVDHRALERRDEPRLQERVRVDAGRVHRLDVVEREPVEALHHQDALGDERGVRAGHDDPALLRSPRARARCRACSAPRAGSRAPR